MKNKFYIFLFLSLAVFGNSFAQDKLILKSGKKINCRIISVNATTIDYKDTTAASSVFTLDKTEILMAELKNGEIREYTIKPEDFVPVDKIAEYRKKYLAKLIDDERGEIDVLEKSVLDAINGSKILSENIEPKK